MDFWKHMNCRKVHGLETIKGLKKVREFETITWTEKGTRDSERFTDLKIIIY